MPLHHWVRTSDGLALAAHTWVHPFWADDRPEPREFGGWGARHLVVLHGACEHSGRYREVAQTCHAHGWNVTTFDFRGHGQSAGARVDVSSVDDYLVDLKSVLSGLGTEPGSIGLLAHSMGGLVALRGLLRGDIQVGCLALSSPLIELAMHVPWWKQVLGRALLSMAPRTRFDNQIRSEQLTHDPDQIAARKADALMESSVTAQWFFATLRAREELWDAQKPLELPVLMLQAQEDAIVSAEASRRFYDRFCQQPGSRFVLIEKAYHEIFNETARHATVELLLSWLEERSTLSV